MQSSKAALEILIFSNATIGQLKLLLTKKQKRKEQTCIIAGLFFIKAAVKNF